MKQVLIGILLLFVLIKGFAWLADIFDDTSSFLEPRERKTNTITQSESQSTSLELKQEASQPELDHSAASPPADSQKSLLEVGDGGFPEPTVQIVNGRPERTIHMGVRQYAWDPSVLYVKQGELVRLVVHNADVQHGLVIPDLNVLNIDIPPEGAVIEFEASKAGTFVFFCSYYCGEDHSVMRGKIIVE